MKKTNFKTKYIFFLIIFGIVLLINFVSAYGISKEYFDGNPAKIGPGETKEISFGLIILSPNETAKTLSIEMINGSDIASLVSEKINVPAGSRDTEIKLRVSIPQTDTEGTLHHVVLNIKDITVSEDSGMVNFVAVSTSTIPILVQKTIVPEELEDTQTGDSMGSIFWAVGVIILIAIIAIVAYLFLKKKSSDVK